MANSARKKKKAKCPSGGAPSPSLEQKEQPKTKEAPSSGEDECAHVQTITQNGASSRETLNMLGLQRKKSKKRSAKQQQSDDMHAAVGAAHKGSNDVVCTGKLVLGGANAISENIHISLEQEAITAVKKKKKAKSVLCDPLAHDSSNLAPEAAAVEPTQKMQRHDRSLEPQVLGNGKKSKLRLQTEESASTNEKTHKRKRNAQRVTEDVCAANDLQEINSPKKKAKKCPISQQLDTNQTENVDGKPEARVADDAIVVSIPPRKLAKRMAKALQQVQDELLQVRSAAELQQAQTKLLQIQDRVKRQANDTHGLEANLPAQSLASDLKPVKPPSVSISAPKAEPKKSPKRSSFKRDFIIRSSAGLEEASSRREALGIVVEEDTQGDAPAPIKAFSELGVFPRWVDQALQENSWHAPTPIQAQSLPLLLAGRSLTGIAQTGSGKTGAFLLPAVVHIEDQPPLSVTSQGPIALVLAPTRELAVQIGDEANKLFKYSKQSARHTEGMRSVCFYGGGRKQDQLWRFTRAGAHVVAATPGRLIDFLSNKSISLERVTYLVFDEADRMLDDGFSGEVQEVLKKVRLDRQVALFSATWPASVQNLVKGLFSSSVEGEVAVRIRIGGDSKAIGDGPLVARKGITQEVVVVDFPANEWQKAEEEKSRLMEAHVRKVLTEGKDTKILVFVNTKALADNLSKKLYEDGFSVDAMHGGRPQETRLKVLQNFREGSVKLLIVTDVFSRGLDIPEVSHVVIFEMGCVQDYIHRIGRTGRGVHAKGHALVFFEYWPGDPGIAAELIGVLERSEQKVPKPLRRIAAEVEAGTRPVRTGSSRGSSYKWAA